MISSSIIFSYVPPIADKTVSRKRKPTCFLVILTKRRAVFLLLFRFFVKNIQLRTKKEQNMKTGYLWLLMWLMAGIFAPLQAQNYDQMWKNVEELTQVKDLPQSALKEVQHIYDRAKAEQNVPQMMKAYLSLMNIRGNLTPDSLQVDIEGLEKWADSEQKPEYKAVLYSILGEVTLPKDFEKGFNCLKLSLKDAEALAAYDAGDMKPMTESGKTSRKYFGDNLYDLLARRAIRLWNSWQAQQHGNQTIALPEGVKDMKGFEQATLTPASEWDAVGEKLIAAQSLLRIYSAQGNRNAWLLTAVETWTNQLMTLGERIDLDSAEAQLREWIQTYADAETCAEVYLALANQMAGRDNPSEQLRIVREGIARYPSYERINELKNVEKQILAPSLQLQVLPAYPGKELGMQVYHRNLKGFTLYTYKIDLPVTETEKVNQNTVSKYGKLVKREHFDLPPTPDYRTAYTELKTTAPNKGIYYLLAVADGQKIDQASGTLLPLTSLQLIYRSWGDKQYEMIVVDKDSGQPVPNAEVVIYSNMPKGYMEEKSYQTDAKGIVAFEGTLKNPIYANARTADDKYMAISRLWMNNNVLSNTKPAQEEVRLFTDRSIYRPGQTVYFSGWTYSCMENDRAQALPGKQLTVTLRDANWQEVGKVNVTSNEFGSFAGQFVLTASGLPGSYTLVAEKERTYIRVEEYKRPTFEVTIDTVKTAYRAGDSIRVSGVARTFAGAPLQGATVRYKVARMRELWYTRGQESNRETGETVTDAEGRFSLPVYFLPEKDEWINRAYCYEITAEVTNLSGETQTGTLKLPIGTSSVMTDLICPEIWVKEKQEPITFRVTNLSNKPVATEVTYTVYRMNGIEKGDSLLTASATSNKELIAENIYALPSGRYFIKTTARDEWGRESHSERDITLFSYADRKVPGRWDSWCYLTGGTFNDKEPATLFVGSSKQDVCLFYDVFSGNKRLESRQIHFSDSLLSFRFDYKEEYGDGVWVTYAFVKSGTLYANGFRIEKPQPDKRLLLKWTTFRDKLQPGANEEWKLNILHPDGTPAQAELLATLYDASLDVFSSHDWYFRIVFNRHIPWHHWGKLQEEYRQSLYFNFPIQWLKSEALSYSDLISPYIYKPLSIRGGGFPMYKARAMSANAVAVEETGAAVEVKYVPVAVEEEDVTITDVVFEEEIIPIQEQEQKQRIPDNLQLRQNFAETAFFYPQLRTDSTGTVSIAFTLPESLTEWKFMGLAHTLQMDYGQISAKAKAVKEFMLQPNMPRFVRVGDKASIAATLVNLSKEAVSGTVRMELFNPETEKIISVQKQKFSVQPNETGKVNFAFTVNADHSVLACRMIADGGTFSDGEQRYIPVLTDKQWITETLPLNVRGEGSQTFPLDDLFNHHSSTADKHRLTVEFTENPVWYAIQALPSVANPQNEDALSWATAYYANSLAAYIVQTHPRIKQVFDSWKAQGGSKETFLSNLQKNQELKNILLAETPWIAEATDEAQQRQRIATLFDLNEMNNRLALSAQKLRDLQLAEGAWSWYKGMSGNRYITTQIMEILTRLQALTGSTPENSIQQMYQQGMKYLTQQAEKECKEMKEAEKKGTPQLYPSEQVLKYLYICALNGSTDSPANRYFVEKLSGNNAGLSIYGKAIGAIVLQRHGKTAAARAFMQSLMEYSVATKEMGRYFDTPKALYSWRSYKIPTEVAAMEALRLLEPDSQAIDEMKIWLLKQKQTQAWDSPVTTADALYALMSGVSSEGLSPTGRVTITLGKEVIRTPENDAAGYIKETLTHDVTDIQQVTVEKEGTGTGWGAIYAQYLEDIDKVQGKGNALSVSRKLYKDKKALSESATLKAGDKVTVRLEIKADRDMDFVQIKDDRAACMEPADVLSGYRWSDGLGYYQVTRDASSLFFIDKLRKGSYVLEYQVYVTSNGTYRSGTASIQSAYAPEFGGHAPGYKVQMKE